MPATQGHAQTRSAPAALDSQALTAEHVRHDGKMKTPNPHLTFKSTPNIIHRQ